jgi:predicted site-specific integrase-resolvase
MLGISKATFWMWVKRGDIRVVKIGGAVFVTADELARLLATEKTAA